MATELSAKLDRIAISTPSTPQSLAPGKNADASNSIRKQRSQRFTVTTATPTHTASTAPPPPVPTLSYNAPPQQQQSSYYPYGNQSNGSQFEQRYRQPSFEEGSMTIPQTSLFQDDDDSDIPISPAVPNVTASIGRAGIPASMTMNGGYLTHTSLPTITTSVSGGHYQQSPFPSAGPNNFSTASALGGRSPIDPSQLISPSQGNSAYSGGYAALLGRPAPDDEIIPTAIVIKNIPFHVPKEVLLGVMEELNLPPPFAFNYHYDNNQFRGLAFANFRAANDANLVVSALNGFDLQGRKLRTEYKKVLKEGEKERIEREKAIKRMRSQQQMSQLGVETGPPLGSWNRREASAPGGYATVEEEGDYGRMVNGQFSNYTMPGPMYSPVEAYPPTSYSPVESYVPQNLNPVPGFVAPSSPPSDVGTSVSQRINHSSSGSGSDFTGLTTSSRTNIELNMNDPQVLEIYSRVLIFKEDNLRDQLAFARNLTGPQRRVVHLAAQKLELEHTSVGEGEDRHVVVYKPGSGLRGSLSPADARKMPFGSATVGRKTARDLFNIPQNDAQYLASPTSALRNKKSMPDIRGIPGNHGNHTAHSTRSTANLREGYATVGPIRTRPGLQNLFPQQHEMAPSPVSSKPTVYYQSPNPALDAKERTSPAPEQVAAVAVRQPKGPAEDCGFSRK